MWPELDIALLYQDAVVSAHSSCLVKCTEVSPHVLAKSALMEGRGTPNPGHTGLHPYNVRWPLRCPAGSSAGSAASVAARFAPWALCEDTGGSCRAPAMAQGETVRALGQALGAGLGSCGLPGGGPPGVPVALLRPPGVPVVEVCPPGMPTAGGRHQLCVSCQ